MFNKQTEFPKGLLQPQKGHRFSVDSIFLSCFVTPKKNNNIVDLGCGCGVISIGILIKNKDMNIKITGIDYDKHMILCAKSNAKKFNLENSFFPVLTNIKHIKKSNNFCAEQFDIVVTNPPYRNLNCGRISPYVNKNPARFEQESTLQDFIKAAKFLVKNKGHLYISYLTERANYLFEVLRKYNFEPKRIKFIHGHSNKPSKIFLVDAIKNGNPSLIVEPPIFQYCNQKNIYTSEALNFCPYLKN